jgi:carbonic anhydrase
MRKLIQGIIDYREGKLPQYRERFRMLAQQQSPDALFITCSDSRIAPNLLVSTHPGELFVIRNVGNLIPPATVAGESTGDVSEASAIEFATLVLGVQDIIVCGHSSCGAMKATLAREPLPATPNLAKWLHHAQTAAFRLEHEGPLDGRFPPVDQLSQLNVLAQLEHLSSYPIVRERVADGRLRLNGWWFDVATGDIYAYERSNRSFVLIDRAEAERLLSRFDGSEQVETR